MAILYLSSIRSLDLPADYDRAYALLSDDRKKKLEIYKNSEARKQVIISELLLRKALADRNRDYDNLTYEYGEYGKPYLKNIDDFFFNISHSGDYVLLGASEKDIGVDIERIKEFNPKVAKRFFTSQEYENIMAQKDEEERKRLFFLYWVIKESFIKYSGKGLSQALNSFRIDIGKNGKITVYQDGKLSELNFRHFDEIEGYRIGSCTEDEDVELKVIGFDQLMKEGVIL
ncbi:MAG: 4'-phosphopantetheinyl transferase superfamily protein [Erysipelotrichaceae bacterium]|nr:4'-phosphopantetheinyl transferase superfamily protein [Erysipelotrichaceae bacterium]